MTITYPLSLPTAPAFRTIQFSAQSIVAATTSPFTGGQEIYDWPGRWWQASVVLPPMRRDFAEQWTTFLLKLDGRKGTFLMGDPDAGIPRGNPVGAPVVDGAGQSGQSVATRGWTASAAGVLLAGDYVQLGSGATARLYKVLDDVDADGSGNATLDMWPPLRESPVDGAPLVTSNAVGLWRLAGNTSGWDADAASIYGVTFSAREAI